MTAQVEFQLIPPVLGEDGVATFIFKLTVLKGDLILTANEDDQSYTGPKKQILTEGETAEFPVGIEMPKTEPGLILPAHLHESLLNALPNISVAKSNTIEFHREEEKEEEADVV